MTLQSLPRNETERKQRAKSYSRRQDYRGKFVGSVTPASWQEKLNSLKASLTLAQMQGNPAEIARREGYIANHCQHDPRIYDAQLGLTIYTEDTRL